MSKNNHEKTTVRKWSGVHTGAEDMKEEGGRITAMPIPPGKQAR